MIKWQTGYSENKILELSNSTLKMRGFLDGATRNPDTSRIRGIHCGYRIEEISDLLTRQLRFVDKLVDEFAKGWKKNKNLRKG